MSASRQREHPPTGQPVAARSVASRWLAVTVLAIGLTLVVLGAAFWWPGDEPLPEEGGMAPAVARPLSSDDPESLLLAANIAIQQGDHDRALALFLRVPHSATEQWITARLAAADLLRLADRLDESIQLFEEVTHAHPDATAAHLRLAFLHKLTGRNHAARQALEALLKSNVATSGIQPMQLMWLANPDRYVQSGDLLERAIRRDPHSTAGRLGRAARAWSRGDPHTARLELEEAGDAVHTDPDACALEGVLLREAGDRAALDRWLDRLVDKALTHPEVWRVVGEVWEDRGDTDKALGAYLEALARGPDNRTASHRAGRLLTARPVTDQSAKQSAALLEHAERLRQLAELADALPPDKLEAPHVIPLAELLEKLGRSREATLWLGFMRPPSDAVWMRRTTELERRLAAQPESLGTLTIEQQIPEFASLQTRFPRPQLARAAGETPGPVTTNPPTDGAASPVPLFVDEAKSVGINFQYVEGHNPKVEGRRMPEFTGGGVAVLDFDLNGRPDLYFTQGGAVPESVDSAAPRESPAPIDRLFAQTSTGQYRDVTDAARIHEPGYSQGVAAGDVNNDGFPDLYVANFGANCLFLNQGDGTFTLAPDPLFNAPAWTTSVAIADVNGDGDPDIYDVNYVRGPDVATLRCSTKAGPRVCAPRVFQAEDDRLCLSLGDGTFRDASAEARINPPGGKGLGLLIGRLRQPASDESLSHEKTALPDVFVANDTEANFLLVADESSRGRPNSHRVPPTYHDLAVLTGTAFGRDGQAQACMGIASADFDADGRLDLFVTNYFNEPNAFYLGQPGGLFDDRAQAAGLAGPSLAMLGFGTQALDVDLDGDCDLVVTNGDLDDFSHEGREFRMRPQLFLNDGSGHFREFSAADPRDYFTPTARHRGRGLARVDWNQDGLEDFVLSQLDEPVALVTNRTGVLDATASRTGSTHGWIGLRLIGTKSARDAIGAVVEVVDESTGQRVSRHWLTAGDGYQATNDRRLILGLGSRSGPFTVDVHFPGGTVAKLKNIVPRTEFVVIEGREHGPGLPR